MTITVTLVDKAADTFESWVDKTNQLANLVSNSVVTATSDANGSVTTGNIYSNGVFAAVTIGVGTALRGGNVQSSAELPITSNVYISGTRLYVGNSTVNSSINSTAFSFNYTNATSFGSKFTSTDIFIGNSTINAVANSSVFTLANSTVTYSFIKPTAAQKAANTWFWNANGSFVDIAIGDETVTTGTSAQLIHSWLMSEFYSMEYTITLADQTANNRSVSKIMVLHDEGAAYQTEFAVTQSNSVTGAASANANSTHVRVYYTPISANTIIKVRNEPTRK